MVKGKISVLVITYNQHDVIARALDSILCQAHYGLSEIVISDDCSSDNNWDVITHYVLKYPNIIRAYRNKSNLGIYGNMQKLLSLRGDADMYTFLSGDDALCDGFFRKAQETINENNINLSDLFSIFMDFKCVYPNGINRIISNKLIKKGSAISLKIRDLIFVRSVLISHNVINHYQEIPLDQGLALSEILFDLQLTLISNKFYYKPFVATIYFANLGVSKKLGNKNYFKQQSEAWKKVLELMNFTLPDRCYVQFRIHYYNFKVNPSLSEFYKIICNYISSFVPKYGLHPIKNIMLLYHLLR
jgi:glycosyltransferase involved in cell wall biosynthesis